MTKARRTLLLWIALGCLGCAKPPNQEPRPASQEQVGQLSQVLTRLTEMFEWYMPSSAKFPLETKWGRDGVPYIEGKGAYVQMLQSSGFFTAAFCAMVARYLDECELEGRDVPAMERLECVDYDLLMHTSFSKLVDIRNLREQGDEHRKEVELVLVGTYESLIDPETPTVEESNLRFSLVAEGGKWKVDRAYTMMGYMENWGLKWE